jgi:uncharacterized protein (TIGR03067 family)
MLPIAAVLIASLTVAADLPGDGAATEEMNKLQSAWQVVKFIDHSGEAAPAEEIKDFTFEFKGDVVIQRKDKQDEGRRGKYTVDVSKNPKWMNIDFGKVSEGIYKLEGDELSLCVVAGMRGGKVAPRPTEFKASKDPPYSLFVLKKVKK